MPRTERIPLKHFHQCWRWAGHWRCAVDLVEQLAEAGDDLLTALVTEFHSKKTTDYPGPLTDAADAMIAALEAAGYRFPPEARK